MHKPGSCVTFHINDSQLTLVFRPFQTFDTVKSWSAALKWWHQLISPKALLVHFPCAKPTQTVVVSASRADSWPPEHSPHLKRSTLQGQSVSKACIFQTLPMSLGPTSDLFPLTIFKCSKINAILGMVPTPAYLSPLLVFNNIILFASPRNTSAVFHNPRTKYPSVLWECDLSLVYCPWNLFCFCPLFGYWIGGVLIHTRET